ESVGDNCRQVNLGTIANPPVNGSCAVPLNTCTTGTFSDTADNGTHFLWNCAGLYGGSTASCSLAKRPNLTPSAFSHSGTIQVGSTIALTGTVHNNGERNTGVSFIDIFEYRIGNSGGFTAIGTEANSVLGQGASNNDSRNFTIPSAAAGN